MCNVQMITCFKQTTCKNIIGDVFNFTTTGRIGTFLFWKKVFIFLSPSSFPLSMWSFQGYFLHFFVRVTLSLSNPVSCFLLPQQLLLLVSSVTGPVFLCMLSGQLESSNWKSNSFRLQVAYSRQNTSFFLVIKPPFLSPACPLRFTRNLLQPR